MPTAIINHSRAKFNIGDKARFNGRVPKYIAIGLRQRARTIIDKFYDPGDQCCYYELGDRGKGRQGYLFRSYMLAPVDGKAHTIGRPRKRRKYSRKVNTKVLLASQNQYLGGLSGNQYNAIWAA